MMKLSIQFIEGECKSVLYKLRRSPGLVLTCTVIASNYYYLLLFIFFNNTNTSLLKYGSATVSRSTLNG